MSIKSIVVSNKGGSLEFRNMAQAKEFLKTTESTILKHNKGKSKFNGWWIKINKNLQCLKCKAELNTAKDDYCTPCYDLETAGRPVFTGQVTGGNKENYSQKR